VSRRFQGLRAWNQNVDCISHGDVPDWEAARSIESLIRGNSWTRSAGLNTGSGWAAFLRPNISATSLGLTELDPSED